jgi:uncharacterized protein involved in type VI secretion and phage assembly
MSFLSPICATGQVPHVSKIRDVQLAIVVDNNDGGGNPSYRVKFKLPWLNEQDTTYWARIVVPTGAGGTWLARQAAVPMTQTLTVIRSGAPR